MKEWALKAWLAQSVERWTFNPTAAGSSPASGSYFGNYVKNDSDILFASRNRNLWTDL